MFNQSLFREYLNTSWAGQEFEHLEEIDSTNTYAKKLDLDNNGHGMVILADHQSSGRGQHNRLWRTESGKNLTFSIILKPKNAERLPLLTLACALAVSESIHQIYHLECDIKWPNDIMINGKKICGILTEAQFSGNKLEKVIVGIGLNVNQKEFGEELEMKASSLMKISGIEYSQEKLLAEILLQLEYIFRDWTQENQELVKRINQQLIGYGEWVKLRVNGEELQQKFKFIGVNENGAFLALDPDLKVQKFTHEQVSIAVSG